MCRGRASGVEHHDEEGPDTIHVGADRRVEHTLYIIDRSVIVIDREIVGEVENQFQVADSFLNPSFESVVEHPQALVVSEVSADLEQRSYEVLDAPVGYCGTLAQYDEMNPFFFAEDNSFADPSSFYQEL